MQTFVASNRRFECTHAKIRGNNNVLVCSYSKLVGNNLVVYGHFNVVIGANNVVVGDHNVVKGPNAVVTGDYNEIRGNNAVVVGKRCSVSGAGCRVRGEMCLVSGENSIFEPDGAGVWSEEQLAAFPKDVEAEEEAVRCVVCLTNKRCIRSDPCTHLVLCLSCATVLLRSDSARCPVCRADLRRVDYVRL